MWGTIIDVVIIGIIIICAIIGIAKGLIDSVLGLVSTGLALVGAVYLSKFASNWVNKIFNLESVILEKLGGAEGSIEIFSGKFSLSNVEVAKFCIWLITVIAIFLLIKLVIFILSKLFDSVIKASPTITGINRLLGMVFGVVKGSVIVLAGLAICHMLGQVPVIGTAVSEKIDETKIASWTSKYVESFVEEKLTKENIQDFIQKITFETPETPSEQTGGETGNTESTPA